MQQDGVVIMDRNSKYEALELAIRSNAGTTYDADGKMITSPDKLVEAAKKFEAYLKEANNG